MKASAEYLRYSDVPKTRRLNLLWRSWLLRQLADKDRRRVIRESCRQGVLFYVNSFVWIDEPRSYPNCLPFVTYRFQDRLLLKVMRNMLDSTVGGGRGIYDVIVEKSRTMGVTWTILVLLDWFWRFGRSVRFGAISRKEDYVDNPGDLDALFPKLDYLEERLPKCLQVRGAQHDQFHGRTRLHITNPRTQGQISGESSNEHAGRGGRKLAIFRDEEASAENGDLISRSCSQTTRCQIRVSTPNGLGNSFHSARTQAKIDVITLHWSEHPVYSQGLYSIEGGKVRILDHAWHKAHPKYEFRQEPTYADPGTKWEFLRSPWFDNECARADSTMDIAQELQISYLGSGAPFFRQDKLAKVRHERQSPPTKTWPGIGEAIPASLTYAEHDTDPRRDKVKSWAEFNSAGLPPQNTTYSLGVDIAAGTGSSDTVISVGDDTTKRKVFEYRSNGITPETAAGITHAIYTRFSTPCGKAFLAWDAGGHGQTYGKRIMNMGSMLVFYYQPEDERKGRELKRPGYPQNRDLKNALLTEYRRDMFAGHYLTHSKDEYDQCEQFVFDGRGGVTHQKAAGNNDPSAIGDQHGDTATSGAILALAMRRRPAPTPVKPKIPVGSFAWRKEQRALATANARETWAKWGE